MDINKLIESNKAINGNLGLIKEETSKNLDSKLDLGPIKAKFEIKSCSPHKVLVSSPKKASILKDLLKKQNEVKNIPIIKNKAPDTVNLHQQISEPPVICSSKNGFSSRPTLNFNGVDFLQLQVQKNPALQMLLKDIVTLNNDTSDPSEDTINEVIANLRARNNLPSLNNDKDVISDTEECYFSDEEEITNPSDELEICSKDSGYSNESHYSGSVEEDTTSETDAKMALEPEYIDLEYFATSNKRYLSEEKDFNPKKTRIKASFPCDFCGQSLNARSTYYKHKKACCHNPIYKHVTLSKGLILDYDELSDQEDRYHILHKEEDIQSDNDSKGSFPVIVD